MICVKHKKSNTSAFQWFARRFSCRENRPAADWWSIQVVGLREQGLFGRKNAIYCIAGDMFRGSVIDSEFRGIFTIEIMNMLSPDVVTIGNHEIDYGIAHLLFLEKCAKFPIINANLHITTNNARLFKSHHIFEIDGMSSLRRFCYCTLGHGHTAQENDFVYASWWGLGRFTLRILPIFRRSKGNIQQAKSRL